MNKHIDELKALAQKGTQEEWCTDSRHGVIADSGLNANYYIASCSGPDCRANAEFIAAASPTVILGLLAKLEAAEKEWQKMVNRILELGKRAEAAEARLLVPVKLPTDEIGEAASFMSAAEVIPVSIVIEIIKAAGYPVEGGE